MASIVGAQAESVLASTPEPASGDGARFHGINALRAAAAFAVVAFHVSFIALPPRSFLQVVLHLQYGVSLFFVISGFLLFRPFAVAIRTGVAVDLGNYWRSRV